MMSEHDVVRPVYHPDVNTEKTVSILSADAGFDSPHDCSIKHRGRIVNIQEIITLIRSGSCNHDRCDGQRQIDEAVNLLEKVQVADQWQPMDTAPKDGTEVLLASGKGTYRGWWRECADKGGGETGPAWQIFNAGDPYESWAIESPECWMNLPFSPKYREYVESGQGDHAGFSVIDKEVKESSDSGSLLRRQLNYPKHQEGFLNKIASVYESAKDNPYWLLIHGEDDEVLGVIGDNEGLSLDTSKKGVIRFIDLPLSCVIERSGKVSKLSLCPVSGSGPSLDMKAGTYAEYERQVSEFHFSDIIARLCSIEVQAGKQFRLGTAQIGVYPV